ncbi:hypothetical protein [Leifsonia shinshuensis]|uniref:Uncharacterized protein n=1 Tax=Leifsonia shinshuensis TaxID=150026 RepID=A0A7G6YHE4_9MICO|nr:hypothetical protein [Leifsonia shinshuensis]QNE37909.1 hypothetical protein F1C12_21745 [Leifsonia shinshuensis]
MSGRHGKATRQRLWWLTAAATVLVGGAIAAIVMFASQPHRVDLATVTIKTGPQQVAANAPIAPAPATAKLAQATDATSELTATLAGDLGNVRSRYQGEQVSPPQLVPDPCLVEWGKENLSALAGTGAYEVVDVCGRPTAVLAGAAGADGKVLAYAAIEGSAPERMKQLIAESRSAQVAVAAVRSANGAAQLIAVAVLPDASSATDGTRVINTAPPGFAHYPSK